MSMVYGFVRQSEGAIDIASRPGHGTTVSLWLPVAETAAEGVPAGEEQPACPCAGQALALLVEDDAQVRRVVRRSLVDLGYAVVEAENGAEAMQILDHTPSIALLLSDVVMPGGVDGRDVARHAVARRVPRVALMSGYAPGEDAVEGGGVPLIAKPFTKRQLAEFLGQHAGG
jgi:CheY-like chemotaxis protein